MPNNELFVNPEAVRTTANNLNVLATKMRATLGSISLEIKSTEPIFQSASADELRSSFERIKPKLDRYYDYLNKVAAYLIMNVADPVETLEKVSLSNVVSIRKPQ